MPREIGDIENDLEFEKDMARSDRESADAHDEEARELEEELEAAKEDDANGEF